MKVYTASRKDKTQILACADIQDNDHREKLHELLPDAVDLVYSDPPWNPGNATYWRTHAGEGSCESYSVFLVNCGFETASREIRKRAVIVEVDHKTFSMSTTTGELFQWDNGMWVLYDVTFPPFTLPREWAVRDSWLNDHVVSRWILFVDGVNAPVIFLRRDWIGGLPTYRIAQDLIVGR